MSADPVRILVLDDDPALLAVLEAGLEAQPDYEVHALLSASEALERLKTESFHLVVTDYSLNDPDINGITVLEASLEREPRPRVIIITAFASLEVSLQAIHLGAYDFLTKPFQMDELLLVVRNAATQCRLEKENQALHMQVAEMSASLNTIHAAYGELLDRIRGLQADPGGAGHIEIAPDEALQANEMRRRRLKEQLGAYVRMGETIHTQLQRERERIETLFREGLLPESLYRKAIERHHGDPPAPAPQDPEGIQQKLA